MADEATRDRVRALVRDVLSKTLPESSSPAPGQTTTGSGPALNNSEAVKVTRDESAKLVITEDDVRGLERGEVLRIAESARLTPLAADIVNERGIEIVRRVPRSGSHQHKSIAVGADHGGFAMKEELKSFLAGLGHAADVGIVIDGAGVGSAMTANKVPGVRAAACYSVEVARNSREHNGANVLTLGSKTITNDQMREIVRAWLSTDLTEDRHRKRVGKIDAIERQYQR
jgi:ribose 5-phosphate isomerase B